MALAAKNNPDAGPYFDHFFHQGSRSQGDFQQKVTDVFDRMQKDMAGSRLCFSMEADMQQQDPISTPSAASANGCPFVDDYLIIDGDDSLASTEGHVHFGDSYASGMGTGPTSWDSFRVGSNNCKCPFHQMFLCPFFFAPFSPPFSPPFCYPLFLSPFFTPYSFLTPTFSFPP